MTPEIAREAYRKQLETVRSSMGQLSHALREMGFVKRPPTCKEEGK